MKTIEINLYSFEELPQNIQEKVIQDNYSINIEHNWWEHIYEDAATIGLKITGFDLDRGNSCDGEFNISEIEVAQKIIAEHGKACNTYITASDFLDKYKQLDKLEDNGNTENLKHDLEADFHTNILQDYLTMLKKEYEYLTSRGAIIETIEANEYTFEITGKMRNE